MKLAIQLSFFQYFTNIVKEGWMKKNELSLATLTSGYQFLINDLFNYGLKNS